MLPYHLPELAGKDSKDTRTVSMALKYVAIAAIAICTITVSALFVKVYILQAEPSFLNKVVTIEEGKKPVHKEQDQVYVVDVNLDFGHPTTITPTLKAQPCEPVNQESSDDKNNSLNQKLRKSHTFQSIIPANAATEPTDILEIVEPIEESRVRNNDSNLNRNPFTLLPSFNFTDEKEQKVNNERRESAFNTTDDVLDILLKSIFDPEDIHFIAFTPIDDLFEANETFLNFPSDKPNFNSEEMLTPTDSLKKSEDFSNLTIYFFSSQEDQSENTNTSSNESRKHLKFPIVG